jgi:hypothetical protein
MRLIDDQITTQSLRTTRCFTNVNRGADLRSDDPVRSLNGHQRQSSGSVTMQPAQQAIPDAASIQNSFSVVAHF